MVCQVALTDGRIILPTVKNSGGTLGHFACCLQNVAFKNHLSVLVIFFFIFFFHTFCCLLDSQAVFSLIVTVPTEPMAQEWNLLITTFECYIWCNQVIIVHNAFIMTWSTHTDPIHHIME